MISDTLSKTTRELNKYLVEPTYAGTYTGPTRERIEKLVRNMEAILPELELPRLLDAGVAVGCEAVIHHSKYLLPIGHVTILRIVINSHSTWSTLMT